MQRLIIFKVRTLTSKPTGQKWSGTPNVTIEYEVANNFYNEIKRQLIKNTGNTGDICNVNTRDTVYLVLGTLKCILNRAHS